VHRHDPLDQRQAEADPFRAGVEHMEQAEAQRLNLRIDPDSISAHVEPQFLAGLKSG
jgi:hypothetical protein